MPPVSDHPKFQVKVVAYKRWSPIRDKTTGVLILASLCVVISMLYSCGKYHFW